MKFRLIDPTKNQKIEMINGSINEFSQPRAGSNKVSEGLPEAIFSPSLTLFNFAKGQGVAANSLPVRDRDRVLWRIF